MAELTKVDSHGVLSTEAPNKALGKVTGDPSAKFDPHDFDVVVIYGFSLVMQRYLEKFADLAEDEGVSSQLRVDAATEELAGRFAFKYAKQIQPMGKKVIIYAAPYRSERAPKKRSEKMARHIPEAVQFATEYANGIGAKFFIQPKETIVDGYFTNVKYAAGPQDNRHMNAAYGEIVLDEIAEAVGK